MYQTEKFWLITKAAIAYPLIFAIRTTKTELIEKKEVVRQR
jgi:hypothetical protein